MKLTSADEVFTAAFEVVAISIGDGSSTLRRLSRDGLNVKLGLSFSPVAWRNGPDSEKDIRTPYIVVLPKKDGKVAS